MDGKATLAQSTVCEEIEAGADPLALIADTMIPAMDEVGKLFREEECFVPELLLARRAMKAAMEPRRPLLAAAGAKPSGVIVAGNVQGDLHDIGKNLVVSMLEGAGFKVHVLGADVSPQKFVDAIRQNEPQILRLSALLTVTMWIRRMPRFLRQPLSRHKGSPVDVENRSGHERRRIGYQEGDDGGDFMRFAIPPHRDALGKGLPHRR